MPKPQNGQKINRIPVHCLQLYGKHWVSFLKKVLFLSFLNEILIRLDHCASSRWCTQLHLLDWLFPYRFSISFLYINSTIIGWKLNMKYSRFSLLKMKLRNMMFELFYIILPYTRSILGQFVLSDPTVVVNLFSKQMPCSAQLRCALAEQEYHYKRVTKNILS